MKTGDIITTIDGRPVKDGDDLVAIISVRKPGSTVEIGYLRNGQPMHATITIGDRDKVIAAMDASEGAENEGNENQPNGNVSPAKLGITVQDLPQGAPASLHGVLIESVKPGSFADEIGVGNFQGGVIISVNRHPVHNVQDFQTLVGGLHSNDDVVLEIVNPQRPNSGSSYLGGTLP